MFGPDWFEPSSFSLQSVLSSLHICDMTVRFQALPHPFLILVCPIQLKRRARRILKALMRDWRRICGRTAALFRRSGWAGC